MDMREDIEKLDLKIKRLKVEYDQYFMRVLKKEPLALRQEVERIILRYIETNIINTSLRFRYQNLVQKYGAYKQHWTNVLKALEDGKYARKAEGLFEAGKEDKSADAESERMGKTPDVSGGAQDRLMDVYNSYIEARRNSGEPVKGITFERFRDKLEENMNKAREHYKTSALDLRVVVKDGKTSIGISPRKG